MENNKNKAKITTFDLYQNKQMRKLFIKKGESFDSSKNKIVFLLHDAQNFFQEEETSINISWKLPQTLEKLKITNYLAFGVSCLPWTKRILEYSPFELRKELKNDDKFIKLKNIEPGGKKYLSALFNNLVPHMEKKYQFSFKDQTTIMVGSSMGGLITTYFAKKFPNILSGYIAFSNCFYANYPQSFTYFNKKGTIKNYYHYMGGNEDSGNISSKEEYIKTYEFLEKWLKHNNCQYRSSYNSKGVHNEKAWQKELPKAIKWVVESQNKRKKE